LRIFDSSINRLFDCGVVGFVRELYEFSRIEKRGGRMRILTMAVAAIVAWCAIADVPTQAEFTAAGKVIADLMEPQMAAMKSGKKKPTEVADYAMSLVGESDTAAAKFLLARRAYGLYMKGGAYDKAVEAIGAMWTAVPDMPNERMLKAVQPDAQNISEKKAPAVCAIIADLRGKVRSQNEIVRLEGELKKAKVAEREGIHRQLGECHAVMGDWKKALEHFAKSGGDVAAMAKAEADGSLDIVKIAGFWWNYSENSATKKAVAAAMRRHAVALYQKGLDDGTISGLNKKLAEQRIKASKKEDAASVPTLTNKPQGLSRRIVCNLKQGAMIPTMPDLKGNFAIEAQILPRASINRFVQQGNSGADVYKQAVGPMFFGLGKGDGRTVSLGILVGKNGVLVFEHANRFMPATIVYQHDFQDKWIKLRVEIRAGQKPLLCVDGKMVATGDATGKIVVLTPDMSVGGVNYRGMYPFDGEIRDFSIYAL